MNWNLLGGRIRWLNAIRLIFLGGLASPKRIVHGAGKRARSARRAKCLLPPAPLHCSSWGNRAEWGVQSQLWKRRCWWWWWEGGWGCVEARLTVCGRDGRGTCDSGFGILFSLDRDEKSSRNKGRNRRAASQLYEAPQEAAEATFTSGPHAHPSSGHTRLGLGEAFGTWCQGKKHLCRTPLGLFHLEALSISTPRVNPENILAVIISIENYEDKLGKSQDAIEPIPFYLYLMRRCHIASENVFISQVSKHERMQFLRA